MTDWSMLPQQTVAMVCPGMPPELGGIETFVSRVSEELTAAEIPVCVFTQGKPRVDNIAGRGYPVSRSRSLTGTGALRLAPGTLRSLRRASANIAVVHAHNFHSSAPLLAWAGATAPLIVTPHFHGMSATSVGRVLHVVYDRIAERIFDRAAVVTCVSYAESLALLRAYPRVANKLKVIPNGVDSHVFTEVAPMGLDRPTALVAGRLVKYKRVDLAIAAVAKVADLQLVVCGDGAELPALQRLARDVGVGDRVRFLGTVSTEHLRSWQRSVPVSLSLSRHEAFGLVAAEAAVAGSFVVASDVPAHRELRRYVGDKARMHLVSEDVGEVASAIRSALAAPRAEPDQMAFYTWKQTADDFASLYDEVLNGRESDG